MQTSFEHLQRLDGKDWTAQDFQGFTTVVSFTDQKAQDVSAKAASALGKKYLDRENFQIVTAVKVPSMFRGLAGTLLKAGQVKARESAAKRFQNEGAPVPENLGERIHVVFDINGQCADGALEAWHAGQAQLLVVDGDGNICGSSSNADPNAAVDGLCAKIDELLG